MADNKKIYTIQINGIDQSIKQVDALSDSLQFLDKKIKELESRSVSITSSNSGVGGGNRISELSTEDKLLKQIQSTEQQIRDARREDYQSLLAQKEILKDITDEAKQRAAAENLSVGNYGNTINGLKQELADIKTVMQSTDLGSGKFNELNKRASELTNKLKELDQSYGQFGRNAGNNPGNISEGFSKLQIEVNGVTREFDNARQALKELTNERNTLKLMGQDVGDLDEVVKTLKSDIKDMEMSSAAMDNLLDSMEGLIALGSTAEGFASLFGFDNGAIEETIQKLVALQNILQGIEVIKRQMKTGEGIGGMFAKGDAAIDNFTKKLFGVNTAAKTTNATLATTSTAGKSAATGLATASAAANTATKSFSLASAAATVLRVALSAIGIGLIIGAISLLIEGISALMSKQSEAKKYQEDLNKATESGQKAYADAQGELIKYQVKLDKFNGSKKQEKKLVEELNSKYGQSLGTYKSLAEWKKVLKERGEALCEVMLNEAKAQALLNIYTEKYVELQKAKQKDDGNSKAIEGQLTELETKIKEIFTKNEELKQKNKLFDYAPRIDETKKSGAKLGKTIKDIEADLAKARIDAMKQGLVKTLAQLELERNKRIAEAKKSGKLVNEQIEQINETYEDKIFNARVEYHLKLINEEKKYADNVKKLNNEMYQNEVEISRKRNELRLENNIDNMTKAPKASLSDGSELDLSSIYENGLRKLTYDYNFELPPKLLRQYKDLADELDIINSEMDALDTTTEEGAREFEEYSKKINDLTNKLNELGEKYPDIDKASEKIVSTTFFGAIDERTTAIRNYYKAVLGYTKDAADKELEIEKDKLDTEYDILKENEDKRHKLMISRYYDDKGLSQDDNNNYKTPRTAEKKYLEEYDKGSLIGKETDQIGLYFSEYRRLMDEWINNLKKGVKKGEYTWEEYNEFMNQEAIKGYLQAKTEYDNFLKVYNKMSAEEQAKKEGNLKELTTNLNNAYVDYLDKVREEQDNHNNHMKVMENKYNLDVEQAEKNHQDKTRQATVDYHSQMISEYERAMSAISSKVDKAEKNTPLGIINYTATKKALNDLKDSITITLGKIATEKMNLVSKLSEGKISFGDFSSLMDQLNTLEVQAQETSDNVSKNLKELFSNTMQSISNIAQQLGSSLNTLIGSLGEYSDVQYENQINALQKFIDKYEEKLQEQREITQEYASEVDSIEQELANARGDRRQHLIDKLNAEMAAQRDSLAQQKKMEKEENKMGEDKKKLEKKRFEEQKKVQTAQAIMSGALAVTNALAVNPFWVGIAMAAMAAASSAAQIATIQSQKYANGGVIEGKSHAQGGVKVLGGQAEVEGGEYITNKVTTSKNVDLLEYINSKKKRINLDDLIEFYGGSSPVKKNIQTVRTKFADGGVVPTLRNDISINDRLLTAFEDYSNRPTVVSVVDIIDRTQKVNDVRVMAGLDA